MEKKDFNHEDLRKLGALIKSRLGGMRPWDKMFGTLCYNIWNHPSNKYLETQNLEDLKWAFGYALGVFSLWEDLKISKVYDLDKLALEAPEQTIEAVEKLIDVEGSWYEIVDDQSLLISIATEFEKYCQNIAIKGESNPRQYFQKGIEQLLFVALRTKRFRPDFFKKIRGRAAQDPNVNSICLDLEAAF